MIILPSQGATKLSSALWDPVSATICQYIWYDRVFLRMKPWRPIPKLLCTPQGQYAKIVVSVGRYKTTPVMLSQAVFPLLSAPNGVQRPLTESVTNLEHLALNATHRETSHFSDIVHMRFSRFSTPVFPHQIDSLCITETMISCYWGCCFNGCVI